MEWLRMDRTQIDALVAKFQSGELSRRGFIRQATALGISAGAAGMLVGATAAQDATPSASPAAEDIGPVPESIVTGTISISREDFMANLREEFEFMEPEQEGGIVIYGETSDVENMATLISSDVYTARVGGLIHESVVGGSPIDGTLVPGLADSWELAEDGLTYTFHFPEDITWHDGTPFTASDVEFSFDATLDENTLSPRRSTVMQVLDSYRVVDDYTFELVANDYWATFLENTVGQFAIFPQHIWGDIPPAEWGQAEASTGLNPELVIGTGPFLFRERVIGESVTLDRNPDYWDTVSSQVPTIETFIFRVIGEDAAALQALEVGEVDFTDVPFADAPNLEGREDLSILAYDTTSFNYFSVNHDNPEVPFFGNIEVRQALMYALDRQLLAEQVYNGYAIQADGTQPTLSVAFAPDEINTVYNFDPDMARQLLEDNGWVLGDDGVRVKDGVRLSFEVLYTEGVATYTQQLPYMQEAWAEIGAEAVLQAVPFQTLVDTVDAYEHQMAVWGFNWSVDGGQGVMFRCDALRPQGFNSFQYCNPEYDALDTEAEKTLDPEARIDLLIEASNIVNDEAVAGILVFRQTTTGVRNTLHNFFPNGYAYLWSLPWTWTEVQD
jgi:peptide/nickel transport system substrate-binding protein